MVRPSPSRWSRHGQVNWVWPSHVPVGKLSVVEGDRSTAPAHTVAPHNRSGVDQLEAAGRPDVVWPLLSADDAWGVSITNAGLGFVHGPCTAGRL